MNRLIYMVLATCLAAPALAAPPADAAQRLQQFEQGLAPVVLVEGEKPKLPSLAERMAALKVPGVSVAVIHKGRIDWARGYGVTQLNGAPVTENSLFQAASISKPVFALAALHLVDAGKLDLDANVNQYLKQWKVPDNQFTATEKVTLRRLFSHSAGLTVHGFPGYAAEAKVPDTVQVLDGLPPANTAPVRVDTVPGSKHRYSGGGYTVAQLVLMDVTGTPVPQLLQDSVLAPLGMKLSTYEQPLPTKRLAEVAMPYRSDGKPVGLPYTHPEMAAAGLWTTPSDLARYAIGVQDALAGKSKIISATTARAMLTPVVGDHGIGPVVGGTGRKYFTHGGANAGYRCLLVAYEDGEGAVVMTNSDSGDQLLDEVMRSIARVYQWPNFAPPSRKLAQVKPEVLERLVGVYSLNEGSTYVLRRVGDGFIGQVVGGAPLAVFPSSDRELFARDANVAANFALDETGKVTRLTLQSGGRERTGVRADEARSRQMLANVEAVAKRFKDQTPRAETEAMLRALLAGIASGKPDYERMTPQFADFTRRQLSWMQSFIGDMGAIKSVTFNRVGPEGGDIYDVAFDKEVQRVEMRFSEDSRIDYVRLLPN
jgi:CubicO group peptidase (beta-lactamase class C family)